MVLAVGNAAAMLFICGKLFSGSTASKLRQWWLLLGANFLFLASRVWMTSIAPAWADYQTNWMVVSVLSVSIATHFLMKTASMIRGSKDEADQKTGQVSDKHAGNKKGNRNNRTSSRREIGMGISGIDCLELILRLWDPSDINFCCEYIIENLLIKCLNLLK